MLFNLNTVGSCFLSSEWQITSTGMFAGSCIGVFLLGMVLEFLRRSIKEYDRFLVRQHVSKFQSSASPAAAAATGSVGSKEGAAITSCAVVPPFRPNVLQQGIRAFLHLLAFVVAYILMLVRCPCMRACVCVCFGGGGQQVSSCSKNTLQNANQITVGHVLQRLHHPVHLPRLILRRLRLSVGNPSPRVRPLLLSTIYIPSVTSHDLRQTRQRSTNERRPGSHRLLRVIAQKGIFGEENLSGRLASRTGEPRHRP